MSYSTIDDVRQQISEDDLIALTDDAGAGVVDETRVTRAIADADEEIDGYVGSRHTVPLSPVPPIVRKHSVDIAIYNLYRRRMHEIPESRKGTYENAIKFLDKIAQGKISLGADDPEGSPGTSDAPSMSSDNPERVFDRDSLKGF